MNSVLNYLKSLLSDGDIIVVAISGGPDSMCLLDLLLKVRLHKDIKIVVANVNHKLRSESDEECEFVEEYAKKNNLDYQYMEIKEYNHDNIENAARVKRYEFFNSLINKYQAKYLMTAHHGDDLMETILMRMVRGSSLKGYSGFKKVSDMGSYKIVRPLIELTKDDIVSYMDKHNLKYFIDKTNYTLDYTRNRYRIEVLPFFKKEQKDVHLKFLKFSEELIEASNFLDKYVKELEAKFKTKDGLIIKDILELDDFLIKRVIQYELSLIYTNDLFLVSDKNTKLIIELLKSKKSNGYVNLPNGYVAIKDYKLFRIEHNIKENKYHYIIDDIVKIPNKGIIKKIKSSDSKSNYVIRLNSKDIKLPLIVRNRNNGDKMEIKNLGGTKKIKDIFIDEKVSLGKRKDFPVVVDSNNVILWLPGVKKSKFDVERLGKYDIILSYEEEK